MISTMNQHESTDQSVLLSIQVGMPQTLTDQNEPDPDKASWTTGFYKSPIEGWANVSSLNIDGDGQADQVHHGGVDKAILAYSADHFETWQSELDGRSVTGGMFGENLTISGLDETSVCIGDQFQINDVVLEVTQPRQPCWKLGRRWNLKELPKRVIQTARCGWYCRVLQTGTIQSGLAVQLIQRSNPTWTIKRAHQTRYNKSGDDTERHELASLEQLSKAWKNELL